MYGVPRDTATWRLDSAVQSNPQLGRGFVRTQKYVCTTEERFRESLALNKQFGVY